MTLSKIKNKKTKASRQKILLIAGIDPTGHAGIFRDAAVCQSLGIEFIVMPTALAIQNDHTYFATVATALKTLSTQWQSLDFKTIGVIKIGMIPNLALAKFLVEKFRTLKNVKIVWDPVLASTSGGELISKTAFAYVRKNLLPLVDLVTPNAVEACRFLNLKFDPRTDGRKLASDFFDAFHVPVYLKGGHLQTRSDDFLVDGKSLYALAGEPTQKNIRGTGCYFSTTVACHFMKTRNLVQSCAAAKAAVTDLFVLDAVKKPCYAQPR